MTTATTATATAAAIADVDAKIAAARAQVQSWNTMIASARGRRESAATIRWMQGHRDGAKARVAEAVAHRAQMVADMRASRNA